MVHTHVNPWITCVYHTSLALLTMYVYVYIIFYSISVLILFSMSIFSSDFSRLCLSLKPVNVFDVEFFILFLIFIFYFSFVSLLISAPDHSMIHPHSVG